MIKAYTGLFGTGKTLGGVVECCMALSKGKKVFSNVPIKDFIFGSKKETEMFYAMENIIEMDNCLVFADEASVVFGSRTFTKTPKYVLDRLAQSRKFKMHFVYTSQGFKHTEKRLRDFTNIVYKAVRLGKTDTFLKEYRPHGFRYDSFDPADIELNTPKKWLKRLDMFVITKWFIYAPLFSFYFKKDLLNRVYSSYDTNFLVQDISDQSKSYNKAKYFNSHV